MGAVLLASVLAFGYIRLGAVADARAEAPQLRVGLVQSNIALEPQHRRSPDAQLADMQRVSEELTRAGAELLVWPESSYPYAIGRADRGDAPVGSPARVRRDFAAPLVFGAITVDDREDTQPHNSALYLDGGGQFAGRYDKIHLLMFGEYIPGVETFPFIRDLLPAAASHLARGEALTTFPLRHQGADYRLAPIICYEDILTGIGRDVGQLHPHLLVNITNDTWFGDTSEPWQHLALSVFRAVELRTDLVRSVNTGVSAHVDAGGRLLAKSYVIDPARTPMPATGLLVEVALLEGGHTFYARFGDVFGYLCVAVTLAGWLLWPAVRRRRERVSAVAGADEDDG